MVDVQFTTCRATSSTMCSRGSRGEVLEIGQSLFRKCCLYKVKMTHLEGGTAPAPSLENQT
jgi:hypothetical protein